MGDQAVMLGCLASRLWADWATKQMKVVVLAVVMYQKGYANKVDALMLRGQEDF